MCAAKAKKTGQTLQPFSIRKENVEIWCNTQTIKDIQEYRSKYPIELFRNNNHPHQQVLPINQIDLQNNYHNNSSSSITSDLSSIIPSTYQGRFSIHELHDAFGPSITDSTYTAITCSEETIQGCIEINKVRLSKNMSCLDIYCTPLAINDKGEKLSSTALRALREKLNSK